MAALPQRTRENVGGRPEGEKKPESARERARRFLEDWGLAWLSAPPALLPLTCLASCLQISGYPLCQSMFIFTNVLTAATMMDNISPRRGQNAKFQFQSFNSRNVPPYFKKIIFCTLEVNWDNETLCLYKCSDEKSGILPLTPAFGVGT